MPNHLMSSGEIAALAQVERPVVTTWRRRHADFPAPAPDTNGQLLFPADAVLDWLLNRKLGNTAPEALRAERTLHTLSAAAREHGGRRLVLCLGAALCLREMSGRVLPSDVLSAARRFDLEDEFFLSDLQDARALTDLPEMVEQLIEGAYDVGRAYQFLLGSAARLGWPELNADVLASAVITLIRNAVDVPGRLTESGPLSIADPYAGTGDLLTALTDGLDPDRLAFNAVQPDSALARLIRRRLLLAGVPDFQFEVCADDLNDDFAEADVIVTRLPYQPAESRDPLEDLNKIGDIADLLGPGRTAAVIGPATSLVGALRDHSAIRRREELLTSGNVEAVVRLPGGVYSARPGYPAALWLLTRDPVPTTAGRLLVADLSGSALDQRVIESAVEDILLWRAEGHRVDGHDPRTGGIVDLADLARHRGAALRPPGQAPLTVRARRAAERPALIGEAERRLTDAERQTSKYVEMHGPLNTGAAQREGTPPSAVSLGALRTGRRVRQLAGHRLSPTHITSRGHYRIIGPAELLTQSSDRWIDRLTLNTEYPHAALTEPGDIVVTTVPRFGAFLDEAGLSVVEFPARGLRVNPGDSLTPRLLKALLDIADNTARSPGAVRAQRLRDVTIPDLSRTEAARLDELLRQLDERERLLRQQANLLTEVRGLAVAGFADGTLTSLYGTNS